MSTNEIIENTFINILNRKPDFDEIRSINSIIDQNNLRDNDALILLLTIQLVNNIDLEKRLLDARSIIKNSISSASKGAKEIAEKQIQEMTTSAVVNITKDVSKKLSNEIEKINDKKLNLSYFLLFTSSLILFSIGVGIGYIQATNYYPKFAVHGIFESIIFAPSIFFFLLYFSFFIAKDYGIEIEKNEKNSIQFKLPIIASLIIFLLAIYTLLFQF